jgi:uncharacterized protein DUF3501
LAVLSASDVVTDHDAYAEGRAELRRRMIPLRAGRRVRVGDVLQFEFENVDTLRYQVQEMVYTERITDPDEIQAEVDLYGRMLPNSHELCATMFIELSDTATVRAELARLAGVQNAVSIEVGDSSNRLVVPSYELPGLDEDPDTPERETVSVHVLRFRFDDAARDAFRDPDVPAQLVVEHAEYSDDTPITGDTRLSLLADLALEN